MHKVLAYLKVSENYKKRNHNDVKCQAKPHGVLVLGKALHSSLTFHESVLSIWERSQYRIAKMKYATLNEIMLIARKTIYVAQ